MPLNCRIPTVALAGVLVALLGMPCLARASGLEEGSTEVSPRAMLALSTQDAEAFAREWAGRRDSALAVLPADAPASARQALLERWAAGVIDYPYFHWRETGRSVPGDWAPYRDALAALRADGRAGTLDIESPRVGSWLHDVAWRALGSDARYREGDNRSLRARVDAITASGFPSAMQRALVARELAAHVDDNGARGIEPVIDALAALGEDAAQVEALRAQARTEDAIDPLRPAHVYQTVDGVGLRLHVSRPPGAIPAPALLWFHGGSGDSGHWSHCPVFCRTAEALGMLVIQVEYRTAQRFNASPADGARDADSALAWVRAHADSLGVDPGRIVVAGFSTGGSMATQLALSHPADVKAAAVMSACVRPDADAWYRRAFAEADLSMPAPQLDQLGRTSVPMLLLHARDDQMCPYPDVTALLARAEELGVRTTLTTVDGGHFFAFSTPPSREQARQALQRFLAEIGVVSGTPSPAP